MHAFGGGDGLSDRRSIPASALPRGTGCIIIGKALSALPRGSEQGKRRGPRQMMRPAETGPVTCVIAQGERVTYTCNEGRWHTNGACSCWSDGSLLGWVGVCQAHGHSSANHMITGGYTYAI